MASGMAHFRCPTFNSLNNDLPNLNRLTLASHNETSQYSSISPLQTSCLLDLFLPASRSDEKDNDFQSNGRIWTTSFSGSSSRLAGLGITCPERFHDHIKPQCKQPNNIAWDSAAQDLSQTSALQTQLGDERMGQEDLSCLYRLPQTWSPSPVSSRTLDTIDMTCSLSQGAMLQYPHLDGATDTTFDSIAAASGMSVDVLAQQLSDTAGLALQYMAQESNGSFPTLGDSASRSEGSLLEELLGVKHTSWPVLPDFEGDITRGLRTKTAETWMGPSLAVNPADTVSGTLYETVQIQDPFLLSRSATSGISSLNMFDGFLPSETDMRDDNQLGVPDDIVIDPKENEMHAESPAHYGVFLPMKFEDDNSDYELPDHAQSSSSPFPSPRLKKRAPILKHTQRKSRQPKLTQPPVETFPSYSAAVKVEKDPPLSLDLGTPVLNAHQGIDLEELRSKAERYVVRNPGRIYDNNWLLSFVGKLSTRGELVEDYRCYVQGCSQTNKRRDHILIHVGSHLNHRPFACAFCPSQFFRNNECKRHELSHSGMKPYVCSICPTAFVRQDLLKRHNTRAHGVTSARKRRSDAVEEEDKENVLAGVRPSKRVKMKREGTI